MLKQDIGRVPNISPGQSNVMFVIQVLLRFNCWNAGPIDGIFGPETRTALEIFQRDHYLTNGSDRQINCPE
jgi:peptidoglycan hydrolase-like protein with peptidoglycan-binding domain